MKKDKIKNLLWGALLVIILLIASHYDHESQKEDRQVSEDIREAKADQAFYEYHNNYK